MGVQLTVSCHFLQYCKVWNCLEGPQRLRYVSSYCSKASTFFCVIHLKCGDFNTSVASAVVKSRYLYYNSLLLKFWIALAMGHIRVRSTSVFVRLYDFRVFLKLPA